MTVKMQIIVSAYVHSPLAFGSIRNPLAKTTILQAGT